MSVLRREKRVSERGLAPFIGGVLCDGALHRRGVDFDCFAQRPHRRVQLATSACAARRSAATIAAPRRLGRAASRPPQARRKAPPRRPAKGARSKEQPSRRARFELRQALHADRGRPLFSQTPLLQPFTATRAKSKRRLARKAWPRLRWPGSHPARFHVSESNKPIYQD